MDKEQPTVDYIIVRGMGQVPGEPETPHGRDGPVGRLYYRVLPIPSAPYWPLHARICATLSSTLR